MHILDLMPEKCGALEHYLHFCDDKSFLQSDRRRTLK